MDKNELLERYNSKKYSVHKEATRELQQIQQDKLGDGRVRPYSKVVVRVAKNIPRLAWLCEVKGRQHVFTIGNAVDIGRDFLFEGVWDDEFSQGKVDETDFAYGSGARFREDGHVVFVPPKHCFEYLFVVHDSRKNVAFISNSMNYVLERSGMAGSKSMDEFTKTLRTRNDEATSLGIDMYDQLAFEGGGFKFYRMMFYNFSVDSRGGLKLHHSLPKKLFKGFDEYREFLVNKIKTIALNGSHPLRKVNQEPITLVSSGYDSPCVAVLAVESGYKNAATIDVLVRGEEDSGESIAKKLGMEVATVKHALGKVVPDLSASFEGKKADLIAEFVATPGLGDNVMLKTLEKQLKNSIYLSGIGGDAVWRRPTRVGPGMPVGIRFNKSSTEFRLRVGYSFVPVPLFGARFIAPIKRITHNPNMEPYTLHQRYDRPIARKIIEEAGIERGAFAAYKAATNPTVLNYDQLIKPSINKIIKRYQHDPSQIKILYTSVNNRLYKKLGGVMNRLFRYRTSAGEGVNPAIDI